MFILIVILVFCVMYGFVGWRLIVPAALGLPANLLLWGTVLLFLVLSFLPTILEHSGIWGRWVDALAWVGYVVFGVMTLLFALVVIRDLSYLLVTIIQKSIALAASGSSLTGTLVTVRQILIGNGASAMILIIAAVLTGYGMVSALGRPNVVKLDVPIKNLPDDLVGFTIVQFTDIHVSQTVRRRDVQRTADMVAELKPDLIALTGDLVDGPVSELADDVAPLAGLTAPYGKYFITGNHEYYSGVKPWLEHTAHLGFDNLINEHRVLNVGSGRLVLAGVTDYNGAGFGADQVSDPVKALDGAPDGVVRILLAHQPKSIYKAAEAGYDYMISGHTHGGQYFPYQIMARLFQPYISGTHRYGNTLLYVSRGTGYWGPPMRIFAPPEITVHRLVKE